jgi:hypothetical protein
MGIRIQIQHFRSLQIRTAHKGTTVQNVMTFLNFCGLLLPLLDPDPHSQPGSETRYRSDMSEPEGTVSPERRRIKWDVVESRGRGKRPREEGEDKVSQERGRRRVKRRAGDEFGEGMSQEKDA